MFVECHSVCLSHCVTGRARSLVEPVAVSMTGKARTVFRERRHRKPDRFSILPTGRSQRGFPFSPRPKPVTKAAYL